MINEEPRFFLDEDGDIADKDKVKVYSFNHQKDWERILILMNTLELQRKKAVSEKEDFINVIKELFEEYNNYIDEYSLIKIDIIMSIASELGIDLE